MSDHSVQGFGAHLLAIAAEAKHVRHKVLTRAGEIVEREAKDVLGSYRYGWPALQEKTIARKATGDSPLLETGVMRDSIGHTVKEHEVTIGSTDPKAPFHEHGTSRGIPPRPFISAALAHKTPELVKEVGTAFTKLLATGKVI